MTTQFGTAGTRTERTYIPSVIVKFDDGEYLQYTLKASGAEPIFSFACKHKPRLSESDFEDHPTDVYEWSLGAGMEEEIDAPLNVKDTYSVGMLFITAVKYTLQVDHRRQNDSLISNLIDVDYESDAPEDKFTEPLFVFSI